MAQGKTKKHMPKEEDWKFKRIRHDDEHVKNCKDGYLAGRKQDHGVSEVHHILNVHSCTDENIPSGIDKDFIYACFVITDWNINAEPNTIGLPKKWAYVLDDGLAPAWDNLPCHQVDHDLYWTAVDAYVQQEIFKKLASNRAKKKCEDVTGENIKAEFEAGSAKWKAFLRGRGAAHGGTKASLEFCRSGVGDALRETVWHVPFSMAPDPTTVRRRTKPPSRAVRAELERQGLLDIW